MSVRKHISTARKVYSFRLNPKNVETVRKSVSNLSEKVDAMFASEVASPAYTQQGRLVFEQWVARQRPEIREAVSKYPPSRPCTVEDDAGAYYVPSQYQWDESAGSVMIVCERIHEGLGQHGLVTLSPEKLKHTT